MDDLISRKEIIDRLERVIQNGVPSEDGMHPISAETVLEVVRGLSELGTNLASLGADCISRQAAIDGKICIQRANGVEIYDDYAVPVEYLKQLPPTQPEIVRCKDCKYWNSGSCEYHEHVVNCQDYWVGDIETEAEHFCGYAKRRDVTA